MELKPTPSLARRGPRRPDVVDHCWPAGGGGFVDEPDLDEALHVGGAGVAREQERRSLELLSHEGGIAGMHPRRELLGEQRVAVVPDRHESHIVRRGVHRGAAAHHDARGVGERTQELPVSGGARLVGVVAHDRVVGDVALWSTDDAQRLAEIGWAFHPEVAGRGLATEAAAAVLDIAFDTYGLHRVAAQLDPRNVASARLCERLGMQREAHLRQSWWEDGEWTDSLVYGLLESDRR